MTSSQSLLSGPSPEALTERGFNWAAAEADDQPRSVICLTQSRERADALQRRWREGYNQLRFTCTTLDDYVSELYERATGNLADATLSRVQRFRLVEAAIEQYGESVADGPFAGIESPANDLIGQVQGLFSLLEYAGYDSPEAIAEEKRILYVAMTRARDHLYLVGTASADHGTMASVDTGDADDPSNWYDFLGSLLVDDAATEALDAAGEHAWHGESEVPLTIRLPRTEQQLTSGVEREAPSLSVDIPELEAEPEYNIPASYLGSLIHDGAPGDVVVDHSGRYVSYVPPDKAEGGSSGEGASPENLPRTVFGSALHKAVELKVGPDNAEKLLQLLEQSAVQADVSLDRIDESDIIGLQRHLRVVRDYLDELDAPVATDERRVHTTLDNGEKYGDIDHLIVTDDAYHIVDYKTNKITDQAKLEEKAQHYKWQMLAYGIVLHQNDPNRGFEATLIFAETGSLRQFRWSGDELDKWRFRLDEEIRERCLNPILSEV